MEAYLQHLKSLRQEMNDHEDKVSALTVEQHEQQTIIRALQGDLQSVHGESERIEREIQLLSMDSGQIAKSMISSHKTLAAQETDSRALGQAWELLKEDLEKQSKRFGERKLLLESYGEEARAQMKLYEAYYNSSPPIEPELETISPPDTPEETIENLQSTDCGEQELEEAPKLLDAKSRLQKLTNEIRLTEEEMEKEKLKYAELDTGIQADEEELRTAQAEKSDQEEFIESLEERLSQLQEFDSQYVCETCGHEHVIKYEDTGFTLTSSDAADMNARDDTD